MLAGFARRFKSLPKAGCHFGLTSLLLLAGAGSVHDAAALNETRTLSFHHTHSHEDLTVTFKRDGRYDPEALRQLNHYLRDWRTQDQTTMDPHLFDILWEVYRDVDGKKPIQIISSYRSPATNAMLHRRSSAVARFSQHMLGHAMDIFIPDVPLEQIRFAGLRLQRGGVGFYPESGSPFVHLDTGSIRHWPRMTHDQLVRVFPDGRTVHVPSDGLPLAGYQFARADIEKRDGDDRAMTRTSPSMWANLFTRKSSDDDDEGADASPPVQVANAGPSVAMVARANEIKTAEAVPMPRAKPKVAALLQLASANAQAVPLGTPKPAAQTDDNKPQTPADIINARGFWGDTPQAPKQATAAQIAAIRAREAVTYGEPQSTASISASLQALAYAPDARANNAAVSPSARPGPRTAVAAAGDINPVVAKSAQGQAGVVAASTRIATAKADDVWLRVVMLAPSATNSMFTTVLGDTDMSLMSAYFVKPKMAVAMNFSSDPQMGLLCERFTGSATAPLATQSFVPQGASAH